MVLLSPLLEAVDLKPLVVESCSDHCDDLNSASSANKFITNLAFVVKLTMIVIFATDERNLQLPVFLIRCPRFRPQSIT